MQILQNILNNLHNIAEFETNVFFLQIQSKFFLYVAKSIVSDLGMWGEWKVVQRGGGYNQDGESWVIFRDAIRDFGWIS